MTQKQILETTRVTAPSDPTAVGVLGFRSMASRTRHKDSDIDALTHN